MRTFNLLAVLTVACGCTLTWPALTWPALAQTSPPAQTTPAQTTPAPKIEAPKTEAPTQAPNTDAPNTDAPKTDVPPAGPNQDAAPPAEDDAPPSADLTGAREITLEPHPVLILKGEADWDEGYEKLTGSFAALRAEAKRLNLTTAGKPLAVFSETDDQKFKFEAMIALDREPPAESKFQNGIATGKSLAGKAWVFNHVGAYDDIDSVYEAITAWLDEKNLTARGPFIEEYVTEPKGSDDAKLELNIYVFTQ